ncbi:hypothetical protein AB0G67_26760 [Streptomyces sp. NPDC021056]|uniref:hypothetical protein n=1 Tax=Streptomyces sp. NPDC021056 TaxID=3155012 RepID=UPI0033F86F03
MGSSRDRPAVEWSRTRRAVEDRQWREVAAEAQEFRRLIYADRVGLFAEETGLSGERFGDFPQAVTRLALIGAVRTLDDELDRGEGRTG